MTTTIEKQEKNFITLSIEIDSNEVTTEYNKACRRISNRINIPGFRKGKAPRNIVEKHVGVDIIKRDVLDTMLPSQIATAIKENKFDVIAEPMLESYDFNFGQNLVAKVKLELRPEVILGEYKNATIEVEEFKHDADYVEKELANLQTRFATNKPVIGRATIASDLVVFDFEGFVDNEPLKGGSAKNYMLDLANSNFIPGFAEQLIGKNISEEFTINVTFPETYHEESLKGKPAEFKIKINEIKEKEIPELNDELAKKVGPYETLEDLKKEISEYSKDFVEAENKKRAVDKIFAKITEETNVEISESMIERETQAMFAEMKERITSQGADFSKFIEREGFEKVISELKKEALKRIKNTLLIHKISQVESIEVTSEDITKKIDEIALSQNMDKTQLITQLFSNQQVMGALGQQSISEKVAEFLLANNNIKYVEAKKEENKEKELV